MAAASRSSRQLSAVIAHELHAMVVEEARSA